MGRTILEGRAFRVGWTIFEGRAFRVGRTILEGRAFRVGWTMGSSYRMDNSFSRRLGWTDTGTDFIQISKRGKNCETLKGIDDGRRDGVGGEEG